MRDPFLINSPGTREVQHEMGLLYDSTINEHWTKDGLWPTSANGSSRLWPCEPLPLAWLLWGRGRWRLTSTAGQHKATVLTGALCSCSPGRMPS